ncbi:MAG: DUF6951 family protein [Anaerolineae bacterium]
MPVCWVKAGECGHETSINARKVSPAKVVFEITSTCERIQSMAEVLGEVDAAHDMSCSMNETRVYSIAPDYVCRNSCVVPAAILKAMEVAAGIFLPADAHIEFLEDTI